VQGISATNSVPPDRTIPVAWHTAGVAPGGGLATFSWTETYSFCIARQGNSPDGVKWSTTDVKAASLGTSIHVGYNQPTDTYYLHNPQPGSDPHTLTFILDSTLPIFTPLDVAFGISIYEKPAVLFNFLIPNYDVAVHVKPTYDLAAYGTMVAGKPLPVSSQIALLSFTGGSSDVRATLSASNLWSVAPTQQPNQEFSNLLNLVSEESGGSSGENCDGAKKSHLSTKTDTN